MVLSVGVTHYGLNIDFGEKDICSREELFFLITKGRSYNFRLNSVMNCTSLSAVISRAREMAGILMP